MKSSNNKFKKYDLNGESLEILVLKSKYGDEAAEGELIKRFSPLVYKEAKKVILKNYDIDDLAQLGYIAIMRAIDKFQLEPKKGSFVAYVSRSVKNTFYELIRKRAKENQEDSLDVELNNNERDQAIKITKGDTLADDFSIEEHIVLKEEREILYAAINRLSEKYREVIIDCVLKDITIKEYAKFKNMSYRMATQRKHRAVELLKKEVVKYSDEDK